MGKRFGALCWARPDHRAGAFRPSYADNRRLNDGVVANVYTIQKRAGCSGTYGTPNAGIKINRRLRLAAAQWHTDDVLNNRALDGDIGSDGSTVADRACAAGYAGVIAETVAINPALAISGVEILQQWMGWPDYMAIMSDCGNIDIGVWSENLVPDRSVVVAVYGRVIRRRRCRFPARQFGQRPEPAQLPKATHHAETYQAGGKFE